MKKPKLVFSLERSVYNSRGVVLIRTLTFSLILTVTLASAQAVTYTLPGNAVFPEGVAYDAATGDFYVGSTFGRCHLPGQCAG